MAEVRVGTSKRGGRPGPRRTGPRRGARPASDEVVVEEASDGRPRSATHPGPGADRPMCGFALCPICTVLTAVGEAKPDLVEHLLVASREVLLAARALIDARLEGSGRPSGSSKLERLSIE